MHICPGVHSETCVCRYLLQRHSVQSMHALQDLGQTSSTLPLCQMEDLCHLRSPISCSRACFSSSHSRRCCFRPLSSVSELLASDLESCLSRKSSSLSLPASASSAQQMRPQFVRLVLQLVASVLCHELPHRSFAGLPIRQANVTYAACSSPSMLLIIAVLVLCSQLISTAYLPDLHVSIVVKTRLLRSKPLTYVCYNLH